MRVGGAILLTGLAVASTASPAPGEWVVAPFVGINLAGDAEFRRGGPGASAGYFWNRLGFELDVQRYNHFFKDANVDLVPDNCAPASHPERGASTSIPTPSA